jgi:FixJ family two-component response regulator
MSTILVVDDDANVAKSVKRLLLEYNFTALTASTSQQALETLNNEHNISVVIADQRMPLMNGVDLFEEMQKTHPCVKRILLTGYTEIEALRQAVNLGGIFKLLLKPWEDKELIECVEESVKAFQYGQEIEASKQELAKMKFELESTVTHNTRILNMNIQSLQRYEKVVEQLPIGIIGIGEDGMVILTNQQFCKDFNVDRSIGGVAYTRGLPQEMHTLVENFSDGSHQAIYLNGKSFHVTQTYLKIQNTRFGKLLSIRLVN